MIMVSPGVNWPCIMQSTLDRLCLSGFSRVQKHALLAAFDSPEAKIQKPEVRSIWHQANILRAVVRYLENTLQCQLYPRYKKTGPRLCFAWDITHG